MPKKTSIDDIYPPEKGWKTIVDFTDGGKTKGVPAAEVIKYLTKIINEGKRKRRKK